MKIAFIGQKAIPFYRDGGVERHVEELATRLAARGHEVTVYVRRRYVATKEDIWRGVRLVRVPEIPTKHLGSISSTFFATLQAVCRGQRTEDRGQKSIFRLPSSVFRRQGYDIIHFHGVGPSLLSWIPRIFTRAKIVVTFHSIDRFHAKWGPLSRLVLWLGEWTAVRIPHATIAVSHEIAKYCKKRFKKNVHYIPNGVEIKKPPADAELRRWDLQKDKYMLTVARLVRHKGIHYLIEAFKQVPDAIKGEMKLVIVGAPSFTKDYEKYLRQLAGEDHRIVFTGYQTGETLNQLYAHAYLYAHPSESEGLSLTILEAMSFGKCVLISNIPENLEVIDHSGVPFEVGNTDDLAEKMASLINHPEIAEAKGKLALGFIKRNFEWDKVVAATEELYKKLSPRR
ncbi:hypothetical protein A3B21_03500 [Candidatus Uhrbacteria bacterium RIFCSPLOWO2_01_FULL_47_24]|uniref:Glycosyltransferase subfamily 4-like N-terminal domain-containing protein n=1 Tax=Candidatus Uhrbacteria bacterium RIFCSPLOWO2_01_FULL_47_24 TaxID=1802401 RepID=A0A1F7UT67_9BACT|nr:MAG: hypothetical protein A2753_03605 [Candidatus Uhrbacteria bacterium RIFCSPHIGHO2_01_FULL_47_11]OGL69079.1 MAG: hypothetical protein A3D58_04170 [Candidatus Uhrbacteria bacterium RIFCSPHIGHO2_02_FULL_46_47]OGL81449.1 MAG: hypothetical protein A3B21_03500 [Candidatus Uhrbacteria bacterium RIFCSPLOWO2_01_FULL_47_24]OGL83717.1 MAG: hypothetical protein A3J03_01670 [Candidatus Uhrbacteria bacterium RIFCSPLOWO2_02_FULL_46_25]OGL93120.1 MAG: hypothetical protein A3H11_03870 [Candidatus Uhrbacte